MISIQDVRDLMRPFLTVWATGLYAFVIVFGLIKGMIDIKEAIAACSVPLGSIYTYHFLKSSQIDKESSPIIQ